jgi:hypothetical protein
LEIHHFFVENWKFTIFYENLEIHLFLKILKFTTFL